jgi:hypothetical protein
VLSPWRVLTLKVTYGFVPRWSIVGQGPYRSVYSLNLNSSFECFGPYGGKKALYKHRAVDYRECNEKKSYEKVKGLQADCLPPSLFSGGAQI